MRVPRTGRDRRGRCGRCGPTSGKSLDAGPTIWKLEFVKGNYGPKPEPLQLRWDTGGIGLRWEVVGEAVRETTEGGYEVDD